MVVLLGQGLKLLALSFLPLSHLLLAGPQGTAFDALAAERGDRPAATRPAASPPLKARCTDL